MSGHIAMTALYQHTRTKTVSVQRFTKHPTGAHVEIGVPVLLNQQELSSKLVEEVLKALNSYGSEEYRPEKARRLDDAEYRRFVKEHTRVDVIRMAGGAVELLPNRHERGGFVSVSEQKLKITPDEIPEKLYSALISTMDAST